MTELVYRLEVHQDGVSASVNFSNTPDRRLSRQEAFVITKVLINEVTRVIQITDEPMPVADLSQPAP